MKVNELQIGDWVLDGNVYAQVTSITCDGNIETTHNEHSNIELIEPIPLVPEILEKNGFKWTTHKSYMVSCIGTVHMVWGFYKDCISISDHSDDGDCQISSLKCKFVHQLQHAMRNCEIKKEIEL